MSAVVVNALVAACITALGIAAYDVTVRQPRTPRLAVVDIARVYGAAERGLKERTLSRGPDDGQPPAAGAAGPDRSPLRRAEDFGPLLESVLKDLSKECRCAIVAMATVVGGDSTIPDYTQEAARRMGLSLRDGGQP